MKSLLLLIAVFLVASISAFANDKVSLQLLWKHQFEFAGFYMAKEKGFYTQAGLDVEIKEFNYGINIVDDVLSGVSDVGVGRSSLVLEKLKGKDIVLLSAIYQSSPYVLISKQRPDLLNIEDFKNKKIMLSDDTALVASILSMMKTKDIKPSDYTEVPHSFNINDLVHDKVDLMTTYLSNEPFHMIEAGAGFKVFDPKDYGFDFYADIVFTSKNYLDSNPKKVENFHSATLKGWEYAFSHIEESVEIIFKKYNSQNKSKEALFYEANILKELAYKGEAKFGNINEVRIQEIANIYKLLGFTNKSDTYLSGLIYEPYDLFNILKKIFTLKLILSVTGIILFIYLMSIYKQYILKIENKNLEKIVNEKTKELQKYNEKLEKQKELYDLVFEKASGGVLLIDPKNNKFIECNDQVVELLNAKSKEDVLNRHPSELSPEFQPDGQRSDEKADAVIKLAMELGTYSFEWLHKRVTGEEFWAEIILTKIAIDTNDMLYVTWKDINEKKQVQQELQKSKNTLQLLNENLEEKIKERTRELENALNVKSNFLANMSHEIRTPLNGIVGFVDILYKNETDDAKKDKLQIIKKSSDLLLSIINDILDFSKIESKKLLIESVPIDTIEIFKHITELFFDNAKEKEICIVLNIDKDLPKKTLGDATRLKQVFSNILSNAIKFANEGTNIVVNVKYLSDSNKLYCEVIDSGIGIEPSRIEFIYNSFEQADSSVSRSYGGTGLGLAISKTLVELMGGNIGVESELGVGSKFYFTVALHEVIPDITAKPYVSEQNKKLSAKVLIVEDNKTNQLLLELLLEELNLDSDIANDGIEAIEMLKTNRYDLVLMDENMPNMSGLEATRVIRTTKYGKDVPIIAVTANALKDDKNKFIQNGMNDYLSKPIDVKKFKQILYRYL
ncbi:ABC transporter substrate-binding protein [Sulfurimonas sp.]|uniref:ABC transporter substrate-binding protein n=1 Tax=Sulfurimonas sp. TaxID=2022749 RepID=UPI003564C6A9